MKNYIQIAIRTKVDTTDWKVGDEFLESLTVNEGLLIPEQVSHNADRFSENFQGKASSEGAWAAKASIRVNGGLVDFYQDFAWRRRKALKCSGSIVHTSRNARGQLVPGSVSFRAAWSEKIDWCALFKTWCEIFPPQLAMLHLFSDPELCTQDRNSSFQIGSFNSAMNPEIPNMGWAMCFGDEFSSEVDADRIAALGFSVEKSGSGYMLRITDSIKDVTRNFSYFSERRAELKSMFREDLFLVKG